MHQGLPNHSHLGIISHVNSSMHTHNASESGILISTDQQNDSFPNQTHHIVHGAITNHLFAEERNKSFPDDTHHIVHGAVTNHILNQEHNTSFPNDTHHVVHGVMTDHVLNQELNKPSPNHTHTIIHDAITSHVLNQEHNKSFPNHSHHIVHGIIAGHILNAGQNATIEKDTSMKNASTNATVTASDEDECTPPAIKQFIRPLMSPTTRRHGGLIIHIVVAVYMFLGLAIVCDEYFVASLDRICEELKMAPDVAGATFMAAGSSAPELATVIIGVFFAKDDIGISGVIGSAVFNIMFVIACCGLCSSAVVYLNWWPLVRDCFFYAVSILVMLVVIYDKRISWLESLMMLLTYVIYCVVLHCNTPLEKWAQTWPVPFKQKAPSEESGLVSYKTLEEDGKHQNYGMEWSPEKQEETIDPGMKNFGMEWSPEKHQEGFASNQLSGPALNQSTIDAPPATAAPPRPKQQDYYKPKEYDPAAHVNPLIKPDGGLYAQATWAIVYPIHYFCRLTMPDCRSDKYKNWYAFTFFISMLWISFYSYFMVWMITIIGYTLGIPDTVMGLTFVAAGVSVPDALSSIAVIKEGYGDMAVSNAVGSNVFDILICLGLPWFIKTAIVRPGSTVRVISKGLTYSTLSLLSTVVFLVVATHINGWKLDRRFGVILMVWYLIFITFASMYELNVFGPLNPPECVTDWNRPVKRNNYFPGQAPRRALSCTKTHLVHTEVILT